MVNGYVSSVFEWRVEKFFFWGDVLSPAFTLCKEPDEVKAQLVLRHVDGFLSVYLVFLPGSESGRGWEHYLDIPGQQTRCDFTEVSLRDGRRVLGIERLLRMDSLERDHVFSPDGVLTFRHHVFQPTTISCHVPQQSTSSSVSRLNVRSTLQQTISIPSSVVHHLDFPVKLTDDLAVTVRVFSRNDQLRFDLFTEGRKTVMLDITGKMVNGGDGRTQRHRAVLTGSTPRMALPFGFRRFVKSRVAYLLDFGFLFHEEGDVAHVEFCEREEVVVEPVPKRRCEIFTGYDVQFLVQGQHFFGNRDVLSRHSPVFERMFATDMLETSSGLVRVKDAEPEAVRLFLSFVHTKRLDTSLQLPQIAQLYFLADRYLVKTLRQALQNHLLGNKDDDETVVMGLRLATLFPDEEGFKKRLEQFLFSSSWHRWQVIKSDAFQEFVREFPEEGNRIFFR